jgi:chromosome partitioning protein
MTPVLAVVNNKGGVGRTTTTNGLARHWQRQGHQPLCIDLDPQANLTRVLSGCVNNANSIGDVMMRRTTLQRATQLGAGGVSLIGSDIKLEDTAAAIQGRSPNHQFLASALRTVSDHGVVLVDCSPAANILTVNALVAATHVLIVLDPELDAIEGMRRIRALIDWLGEELGEAPAVVGALINKVQGHTNLHRTHVEIILNEIGAVGVIPYRRGTDADEQIDGFFAAVADKVWSKMQEASHA